MNTIVKYVVGHTYKPLLEKYLSKKRIYRHNGFKLEIPPEVFHPGFFFSTRLLMQQLDLFPLNGKTVLELGAGSGLISMHAAKQGAIVTATDLNQTAIDYLRVNSKENGIGLNIIHSDLFDNLPQQQFDLIIINPPYYKKDAITEKDLAWCCGSKGEYFEKLFNGIGEHMHDHSEAFMVLCDGCDLQMIVDMARSNGFSLDGISTHRNLLETNFIFKISRRNTKEFTFDNYLRRNENGSNGFVEQYLSLRKREGRIYTDEELLELPSVSKDHPLAKEWAVRERSAVDLVAYLYQKGVTQVLEVGCGNGWLSNMLARVPSSEITAIDVNGPELEQGARVFSKTSNLRFIEGDLSNARLKDELFDVIVFAASIQYFENLDEILELAFVHLKEGGEVHIIDSFFYSATEVHSAKQRSRRYFEDKGFPLMTNYYFHHSMQAIKKYKHRIFYDPNKVPRQLMEAKKVFPWIMVQPNK